MRSPKKILVRLPAPLIALAIILLSSQSTLPLPQSIFGVDKIAHAIAFGSLAGAIALWVPSRRWMAPAFWRFICFAAGIAILYGISDEIHQSFVPGRFSSVYDVIADAIGAFAGATVMRALIVHIPWLREE